MATKAFITGAGGCIGQQLVNQLVHDGWDVTALLLPNEDNPFAEITGVISVVGDIRDIPPEVIPKESLVFHLAAKVHSVPKTAKEKEEFFSINHAGTVNIARNAVAQNATGFVFLSTLAVYGDSVQYLGCDENAKTSPMSAYGKSKLKAEQSLREILLSKVPYAILRPCVVYGPNDRGNFISLINWITKGKLPYPLVNGGQACKNVLSVHDLINVIDYLGVNIVKVNGEIFNIANPDFLSMNEIVKTISRAANIDHKVINIPSCLLKHFAVLGDVFGWIFSTELPVNSRRLKVITTDTLIDTSKLQRILKNEIQFTAFEDGVRQLLEETF